MNRKVFLTLLITALASTLAQCRSACADDDVVQTVINLVSDKDKDVRAVGLEQVRDEAKGEEATKRFAALLSKLEPDAQVGLLGALAGRGDAAAKPAVLDLLKASQGEVRSAAIRALGPLGDKDNVSQLVGVLGDEKFQKDAADAITHLHGEGINGSLCAQLKSAAPAVRVQLLNLLVARHAVDSVPALLAASKDEDAKVRAAALDALGKLAGPELIGKLAQEIIDSKDIASREEAEKSLAIIARRDPKNTDPAVPLLKVIAGMPEKDRATLIGGMREDKATLLLLPALGRIGGPSARKVVDAALASGDIMQTIPATMALCNWPDGSVAPKLIEIIQSMRRPGHEPEKLDLVGMRNEYLGALIRIAPLPDGRSDAERLKMLKKAMELSDTDAQRTAVIKRARAIRSLETFRFVAPYMDDPKFTQIACETVVELAHHKVLRQPNKAEFNPALDKVIKLSKDPEVVLRAKHYLKDETWVEKQLKGK